jgi:hypothetical protein
LQLNTSSLVLNIREGVQWRHHALAGEPLSRLV